MTWPRGYWRGWSWPRNAGVEPDHLGVVVRHASSAPELTRWLGVLDEGEDRVADLWCDALADAVRKARSREIGLDEIVGELVCPFFMHAEYRNRQETTVGELERYVETLGLRLAARLHG